MGTLAETILSRAADHAVREGDLVGKGQVIGRIVDNQLGYQAGAYGAQAAAAQAQVAQADEP